MFVKIITALSIFLVAWTSIEAQNSLPWDLLYPIKININESVQTALTFWIQNQAELQLDYIDKRLQEKQELKNQWKLTFTIESDIDKKIWFHTEEFNQKIYSLEKNISPELVQNLEKKFLNFQKNKN